MRTAGTLAVIGLCTWVAFKVVFGFVGGIVGLLLGLVWFALKLLLVVGLVYWVMTVVSPDTAQKMRDAVRGESP